MKKNVIVQVNIPPSLYPNAYKCKKGSDTYGLSYEERKKRGSHPERTPRREGYKEIGVLSEEACRSYAKTCSADYKVFTEPVYNWISPSFERFRLIEEDYWADTYDNILYVDYDVIIHPDSPNIFKAYPQDAIRVVAKRSSFHALTPANLQEMRIFKKRGIPKRLFKERYFNAGVILFNKNGLRDLKKHVRLKKRVFKWRHGGQGELNFCILKHNIPCELMDSKFNRLLQSNYRFWSSPAYFFHFLNKNFSGPTGPKLQDTFDKLRNDIRP